MRTVFVSAAFALAFLASAAIEPAATAHPGQDCPIAVGILEAECYTVPVGTCNEWNEHVEPITYSDGTVAVILPDSGCGILFDDITITGAGLALRGQVTGSAPPLTLRVSLEVDGALVGRATIKAVSGDPFQVVPFDLLTTQPILPGTHDVVVRQTVTSGPSWANLYVDHVVV